MSHLLTDTNALLGQSLGTCTIQHLIGRGGMGAVYLAQQTRPRREVAVKVLIPGSLGDQPWRIDFLARFRREADAIAALDHVHIIPIYEYGEQEQVAYLVMPYVTGGSLHQLLEKWGALPLSKVLPILEQAAAALDYAHTKGIIHRDLKPGNILFHADGRVLLADFGLAKVLREEGDQNGTSTLTNAGTVIGTPEYLSPEQAAGQPLDQRTDIYSLGIVLFHMLTGHVPSAEQHR
jgi:serine/threonine protein kinase